MALSIPEVQVKSNAALSQGIANTSPGPQKPLIEKFSPIHVSSTTPFLWSFFL